ncbi:unnamed protein product [Protopolystoma xenopodis]|uniref:Uncharacterized protein n=1 Tax=Protopolystoma xenopodis TaxID=117903 RepID=A0A3S5A8Z0_9PLAT|nr:unnamed protein product [Protopolystoma xenopodis]
MPTIPPESLQAEYRCPTAALPWHHGLSPHRLSIDTCGLVLHPCMHRFGELCNHSPSSSYPSFRWTV